MLYHDKYVSNKLIMSIQDYADAVIFSVIQY